MGYNDKKFGRLIWEDSNGRRIAYEWDHTMIEMEELLNAFYSIMIGITWQPTTILSNMKEFAEEKLGN